MTQQSARTAGFGVSFDAETLEALKVYTRNFLGCLDRLLTEIAERREDIAARIAILEGGTGGTTSCPGPR